VSSGLRARGIAAVLLDIEGTTTPIAFVHDVLFPFARRELAGFLRSEFATPQVHAAMARLSDEHAADLARGDAPPPLADDAVAYAHWLMDRDRKSPGLKDLQGLIWERGYRSGQLRGQVYPDVPAAMRRWRADGLEVAIYSSGSALAQRLLFESTAAGDLTPMLSRFFDTAMGPKRAPDSYFRIAGALGREPRQILFVSDIVDELEAARAAGLDTRLSIRPGNSPQCGAERFVAIRSFDEVT